MYFKTSNSLRVDSRIISTSERLMEFKGRETHFISLETKIEAVRSAVRNISISSTNSIENINIPFDRETHLWNGGVAETQIEKEYVGAQRLIDFIIDNYKKLDLSLELLLELHRLLMSEANPSIAGKLKSHQNVILKRNVNGQNEMFETVHPSLVKEKIANLITEFKLSNANIFLKTALFVSDFLLIHPFADGNGRMSRALTMLLLLSAGVFLPLNISLDKIISDSKSAYYSTLNLRSIGYSKKEFSVDYSIPFVDYMMNEVFLFAYLEWDKSMKFIIDSKSTLEKIKDVINEYQYYFSLNDIKDHIGRGASHQTISKALTKLEKDGYLTSTGIKKGKKYLIKKKN